MYRFLSFVTSLGNYFPLCAVKKCCVTCSNSFTLVLETKVRVSYRKLFVEKLKLQNHLHSPNSNLSSEKLFKKKEGIKRRKVFFSKKRNSCEHSTMMIKLIPLMWNLFTLNIYPGFTKPSHISS